MAESYRAKLFAEVQHSLRPGIAAKICKINICMPITVFVDLFNHLEIKVCKTMLTYKADGIEHVVNFLDDGWDKRTSNSMYCEVVLSSIQLKYMIGSQNVIFSFYYKRSRMRGTQLVPMEQDESSSGPRRELFPKVLIQCWQNCFITFEIKKM